MSAVARCGILLTGGLLLGLMASVAQAAGNVTADHGVAAGGDISGNITIGLTPKQVRELVDKILAEADADTTQVVKLATELGVTQGAVTTFLRTLGEKDIPIEELPAKLGEIAERHRNLLAQIEQVRSASPDVQAIKDQAKAAVEQGDYDRAEDLLIKAEDAALASADRLLLDAAALRAERGELARTRLDYRTAAGHFAAAADRAPASEPLIRADYLNRQGLAAQRAGEYAAAGAALEEALRLREAHLDPRDPDVGTSFNNLAELHRETGRYAEAEPLFERAIAIIEAAHGPEHPDVASGLNNLALLYHDTGRYPEAEPLYQRALAITEAAHGPEHPDVATGLNNLAALYQATGRYVAAEPLYQRARRSTRKRWDRSIRALPLTSTTWPCCIRRRDGTPRPSRCSSGRPRSGRKRSVSKHPEVALALNNLAALYRATGRYAEAEPLLPAGAGDHREGARFGAPAGRVCI